VETGTTPYMYAGTVELTFTTVVPRGMATR